MTTDEIKILAHATLSGRTEGCVTAAEHENLAMALIQNMQDMHDRSEMDISAKAAAYGKDGLPLDLPPLITSYLKTISHDMGLNFYGDRYYITSVGYNNSVYKVTGAADDYADLNAQADAEPHQSYYAGIFGNANTLGRVSYYNTTGANFDFSHILGNYNVIQKPYTMCIGDKNIRWPSRLTGCTDGKTRGILAPVSNGYCMMLGWEQEGALNECEVCVGYAPRPYSQHMLDYLMIGPEGESNDETVAAMEKVGPYSPKVGQWDTIFDVGNGFQIATFKNGTVTYKQNALDIRRNNHIFGWLKDPNKETSGKQLYKYVDITDIINRLIAKYPDDFHLTSKLDSSDVIVCTDENTPAFRRATPVEEFEMYATTYEAIYEASVVEGTETPYRPDKGIPKKYIADLEGITKNNI